MQCHSLDTLGLMARTLDDIALFRGAVLKLPPVPIARGIARRASASAARRSGTRPRTTPRRCWKRPRALSARAPTVVDIAFAPAFADILDDHGAITAWEGVRNYADERLRNPDKVSRELMDGR